MKKFLLLLTVLMAVLIGCKDIENVRATDTGKGVNGYSIIIIEFDSCEYLVSGVGYSQMMAHKGNCKFCAARNKKQP